MNPHQDPLHTPHVVSAAIGSSKNTEMPAIESCGPAHSLSSSSTASSTVAVRFWRFEVRVTGALRSSDSRLRGLSGVLVIYIAENIS